MPLAIPNELKKIQPVVRRAEELDRDKVKPESRIVAYYCRQYAVHKGIPLAGNSTDAKTCLGQLLEQMEAEKAAMDQFTREEAAFLCRKFATEVFDKADFDDREGKANQNTAKAFYAASTFLQILEQFYSQDASESADDRAQDRKRILYSKWKATEILKAIKEGRDPTPGGYDPEENDLPDSDEESEKQVTADTPSKESTVDETLPPVAPFSPPVAPTSKITPIPPPAYSSAKEDQDLGPPPAYPSSDDNDNDDDDSSKNESMTFNVPPAEDPLPAPRLSPPPASAPAPSSSFFSFNKGITSKGKVSKALLADATELTRFALAALEDKDADLAAERLQKALHCLGR